MCNVSIAKNKLQNLTRKTERDLYLLKYEEHNFTPLTNDVYYEVKVFCKKNDLPLPISQSRDGELYINPYSKNLFPTLKTIAEQTGIVLDYSKLANR